MWAITGIVFVPADESFQALSVLLVINFSLATLNFSFSRLFFLTIRFAVPLWVGFLFDFVHFHHIGAGISPLVVPTDLANCWLG